MSRQIAVDPVTRIEGHAKIVLNINDSDQVESGHLQVLEVRGFEKLLEGMELTRMPLITGRVCGVCPAAHHLASVVAIESGLGVSAPPKALALRNLLYAGHILHSHALSTFLLVGPDILMGLDADPKERNVFGILKMDPDLAKKVLRLRSIGQKTVEIVGGRGVHPVASVPGGMASEPTQENLDRLSEWGKEALGILLDLLPVIREKLGLIGDVREATAVPFPSLGLSNNGNVDFLNGTFIVMDEQGNTERTFSSEEYADNLIEHVMPGSYMKAVKLRGTQEKQFIVGPLARLNVNNGFSTDKANDLLKEFHDQGQPRTRMLDNLEARMIEMVHCAEQMALIAGSPLPDSELRSDIKVKAGKYIGAVEAPRGLLVHDYTVDDEGIVTQANLIVATQNNYYAIDETITSLGGHLLPQNNDNQLMNGMEFALRMFDPCLACATHAAGCMPIEIELRREGGSIRTVSRR